MFREPVQIMMSHLKTAGSGAPCLRDHRSPRADTCAVMGISRAAASRAPREEYCAGHLAMLSQSVINIASPADSKGLPVDYEALPDALPLYIMEAHFGAKLDNVDTERMLETARFYSKARGKGAKDAKDWEGDSAQKEAKASEAVRTSADKYVRPRYTQLLEIMNQRTSLDIRTFHHDAPQ